MKNFSIDDIEKIEEYRNEDIGYLSNSLKSLQLNRDVKKIIVVSSCTPGESLLYQSRSNNNLEPGLALVMDTEHKVSHWLYSGTDLTTDNTYNRRRYVNNPKLDSIGPYWPKRIII
jgi:hypothetical protein